MKNITTLRPAMRILFLYSITFLLVLSLLVLGLEHLHDDINLNVAISNYVWKVAIFIGFLILSYAVLWRLTSVFTISTECIASTIGILSKSHIRIPLNRVVDYQVVTPLLERILGLGSIHIDTAGEGDLIMRQISREEIDLAVRKLDKLLSKEQHRSDNPESLRTLAKQPPLKEISTV